MNRFSASRHSLLAIALALTFLALAGCGGGGDGDSSSAGNGDAAPADDPSLVGTNGSGASDPVDPGARETPPPITMPEALWQTEQFSSVGPLTLLQALNGYRLSHSAEVTRLRVSPDDQWLASASNDNTVRIWQLATGREARLFQADHGEITDIAFSSGGQRLLIGYTDGHVIEWSLGWNRFRQFDTGNAPVTAVAYLGGSPGTRKVGVITTDAAYEYNLPPIINSTTAGVPVGTRLAAGSPQSAPARTPGILIVRPEQRSGMYRGRLGMFSADGRNVAVLNDGTGQVHFVATAGWRRLKVLEFEGTRVTGIDFTPTGNRLVTRENTNVVTIYNDDGDTLGVLPRDLDGLAGVRVSRNGHEMWTWFEDGRFRRWSVENGRERPDFAAMVPGVSAVAGTADNRLIVGTIRGDIFVYNASDGRLMLPERPFGRINAVAISQDGTRISVGTTDGRVRVLDRTGKEVVEAVRLPGAREVQGVGLTSNGNSLMAHTEDLLVVYSVVASRETFMLPALAAGRKIRHAKLSADGRLVLCGFVGTGAAFEIWDIANAKMLLAHGTANEGGGVVGVAFAPNRSHAVLVTALHNPSAPPGTTEGAPYRATFVNTADITSVSIGASADLASEPHHISVGIDGTARLLTIGPETVQTTTVSGSTVTTGKSIKTEGAPARPALWTADGQWVVAGSASFAFSVANAVTGVIPATGSANMDGVRDRVVAMDATFERSRSDRELRTAHVVLVTARNAVLLYSIEAASSSGSGGSDD